MVQAVLLQGVQLLANSFCFIQIANPWHHHTVYFEPSLKLPLCLSSLPTLASRLSVWIALHNLQSEPITLHTRHRMGTVEAAEVVEPEEAVAKGAFMSMGELVPNHVSPVQQRQLVSLLEKYQDIFSRDDDDIGQTSVLEQTIETQGPPVWLPYHW